MLPQPEETGRGTRRGQARAGLQRSARPGRPRGRLTAEKVCKAVGHLMPENAIIVDEAITSGLMLPVMTAGAPRHDLITLTGGAIGQGLPNAVGRPSPARTVRCWP
jgi:acetolactate synthase I/II/III large subunit